VSRRAHLRDTAARLGRRAGKTRKPFPVGADRTGIWRLGPGARFT
jgi:hypothetical protein